MKLKDAWSKIPAGLFMALLWVGLVLLGTACGGGGGSGGGGGGGGGY